MTTAMPQGTAPKRSRARALLPLGILVWIALEIWLLTLVGGATGGLVVLLIIVAGVALGSVVVKTAGRRAFQNLRGTLQQQQKQEPGAGGGSGQDAHSARNGFLMLGGLLIMIPGLITDAVGLLLLIPPIRSLVGRFADRSMEKRMRAAVPDDLQDAFQQAQRARMGQDGKVVQGEVVRDDDTRRGAGGDRSSREDEGPRPPLTP